MIKVKSMTRTKCKNMLRLSGQNADQKLGQIANNKKSPDKMPTFQLSVGILSYHHRETVTYYSTDLAHEGEGGYPNHKGHECELVIIHITIMNAFEENHEGYH